MNVVGSVCDQASTNISAVELLVHADRKGQVRLDLKGALLKYSIKGSSIIHWYDAPHLIKGARNNLLTKDLVHYVSYNGEKATACTRKRIASWEDIIKFFEYQKHLIPKITEEHIKPKRKMKVKLASQVFSKSFGESMKINGKNMKGTAEILLFFNDVFDSLNGSGDAIKNRITGSVSSESGHRKFWSYAVKMLSKMQFIILKGDNAGKVDKRSKTISSTITTIKAFQQLSEILFEKQVLSFSPRRLNSDPLENFFGGVRACCSAAVKPTTRNFRTAFSTMIVNNLSTKYSINFNCEEDHDVSLLKALHSFYDTNTNNDKNSNNLINTNGIIELLNKSQNNADKNKIVIKQLPTKYAEAVKFIHKKMLKKTKCDQCASFINESKTFTRRATLKNNFKNLLQILIEKLEPKIKEHFYEVHLKEKAISNINLNQKVGCQEHTTHFTASVVEVTFEAIVSSYTKTINELLSGKSLGSAQQDQLEQKALEFFKKGKHIGKYSPPDAVQKIGGTKNRH